MAISINIPKDQEQTLRDAWGPNLDRAALEALAIEGYRSRKLSAAEVGRLLGLEDRWAVNQWLADHKVPLNYTLEDLESDRRTLKHQSGDHAEEFCRSGMTDDELGDALERAKHEMRAECRAKTVDKKAGAL